MSKICDRKYDRGSMYAVKEIRGAICCPSCEQPTWCHGKSLQERALFWALSEDTGTSSEAIARHMLGFAPKGTFYMSPPYDASDRGRCIRLLGLIPEWLPRIKEMTKYDRADKDQGIVINATGISADRNNWSKQLPLIIKEGKF